MRLPSFTAEHQERLDVLAGRRGPKPLHAVRFEDLATVAPTSNTALLFRVGQVETSVSGLNSRMTTAESDISTLESTLAALFPSPTIPAFAALVDQTAATLVESAAVTVTGAEDIVWPAVVRGQGTPEMQVNGGAWVTEALIRDDDTIKLRMTTSANPSTTLTATLYSQKASQSWTTTTIA